MKEDVLLIGEIWENAQIWLLGDQFDSTMNYTFMSICQEFFGEKRISVEEFDGKINAMLLRYPYPVSLAQMNFLDTHDVPRFFSCCGEDRASFQAAVFFLMTSPGAPSVFYGDEALIPGKEEEEYRAPMPWGERVPSIEEYFKKCIKMRRSLPALTRGNFRSVIVDNEKMVYGFTRKCPEQEVLVLLQLSQEKQKVVLPERFKDRLCDWEKGEKVTGREVELSAMEGKVFVLVNQC